MLHRQEEMVSGSRLLLAHCLANALTQRLRLRFSFDKLCHTAHSRNRLDEARRALLEQIIERLRRIRRIRASLVVDIYSGVGQVADLCSALLAIEALQFTGAIQVGDELFQGSRPRQDVSSAVLCSILGEKGIAQAIDAATLNLSP